MKTKTKQLLMAIFTVVIFTTAFQISPAFSQDEDEEVNDPSEHTAKGCRATGNGDDYCTAVKDLKVYGCSNNSKKSCEYAIFN